MIEGSIQSALFSRRYVSNVIGLYTQYDLFMIVLEEYNYIVFNNKFLNRNVCKGFY